MELFFVAWKNVFRNKRRSVLTIIALSFCIALMIIGLGWVGGYLKYIYGSLIDFETGHVHILHESYQEEERRMPLDIAVQDYQQLREELNKLPFVKSAAGRINFTMKLSNGRDAVWLAAKAIDAQHEKYITILKDYLIQGLYLEEQRGLLIGRPLAQKLGLKPGDTIYVTARNKHNVENFLDMRVAGIFEFGYPALDNNLVYMDMETAALLLDMEDAVTRIVLRLQDGHVDAALSQLDYSDKGLKAYSWKEFAQTSVSAVEADTEAFYFMLAIIYMLALLGILNAMSMSVHERTQEIGTLRAIGMKKRELTQLFFYESIAIALISIVAALILSLPVVLYLQYGGIDVSAYLPEELPIPFGSVFYANYTLMDYAFSMLIGFAAAVLGSWLPAKRASKLLIADALRKQDL